jgi:predicted RNA-binding Zn ribbon-like protein
MQMCVSQNELAPVGGGGLKACQEHGCRWVFYDHSRNRSSTWCAITLCGTRAKMRAYRARRAASPTSPNRSSRRTARRT